MLWFENEDIETEDIELLYPLKQTEGRDNVQISIGKLGRLAAVFDEFFIVIHDGERKAYYIPFSYMKEYILPRARIRVRPHNPNQRYLTVDQIRGRKHILSFGNDIYGNPLRVNLKQFYKTINAHEDIQAYLEAYVTPQTLPFTYGDGPFIINQQELTRYRKNIVDINDVENDQQLLQLINTLGFNWEINSDRLIISHPNDNLERDDVINKYIRLLRSGRINPRHNLTEVQYRPYQHAYREALIEIYNCRCAMCDVDVRRALVASHIRPVRIDIQNRINLMNGLLLCGLHDALFDSFLITVQPNYRIAVSSRLLSSSSHIEDWVLCLDGERINLPSIFPPEENYLQWHSQTTLGQR